MMTEIARADKIMERINQLATASEETTCLTRRYGSQAFLDARSMVMDWMREAGLDVVIDNIGNVRGKLLSSAPGAKTLVIGSHIDSVRNAGKFDGPLGVLIGIDLVENIVAVGSDLPFNVELVAFCDEEGVRFHTTYLGSRALIGKLDEIILSKKDESGYSVQDVLQTMGGMPSALMEDAIPAENWLGYYEIHIEQGPVLYERNIPVAVVSSIAGQRRAQIIFRGVAGHAGTVPMDMRNDALTCAAEFILELEEYATIHKKSIVATVGKLNITHQASNVIPGEVICTLDLRCDHEETLFNSYHAIKIFCEAIAVRRNISVDWDLVHETAPTLCDEKLEKLLSASIKQSGFEVLRLVSGAGHDAVAIAPVAPVIMLFVQCFKGISHNPLENVKTEDIAAAIKVSDNFIQQLGSYTF